MARKVIVLALLLVAIVGMASAKTANTSAEAPISDDVIGTDDGSEAGAPSVDGVVAGPLGNTAAGAGSANGEAAGPSGADAPSQSDATALKVSAAIAGVAAVAGYFF